MGRVGEQERFRAFVESLLAPENSHDSEWASGRRLLVTGQGGIGKSSLLRSFMGELAASVRFGRSLSRVFIDWSAPEHALVIGDSRGPAPEDMMSVLVRQLRKTLRGWSGLTKRGVFDDFDKAQRRVGQRRDGVARTLGGGSTHSGAQLAGSIAGGITQLTPLAAGSQAVERLVEKAYGGVAVALAARGTPRPDNDTMACREALAKGVRDLASVRPLVIVLDTCELLGEATQDLQLLIRQCGPRVLWIIGVRLESLADAATDSATTRYHAAADFGRAEQLALGGLDVTDIGDYLSNQEHLRAAGVETAARLHELTNGVPLAISLATGLLVRGVALDDLLNDFRPNPDAAELIRQLAERYLRHVSTIRGLSDDLPLLYGLALLPDHVDDYSILAALWDVSEKRVYSLLRQLADRHDFVHSRHLADPQAVMHSLVRDTLRRSLFDEDKRILVREANERAIAYINRRLAASALVSLERQLSVDDQDDHVHAWQSYALALLWYTFWVDAAEGVALTRHLYPPAALLAPAFAQHQAAIIRGQLISPRLRGRRMLEAIADADGSYLDAVSLTEVLNDLTRTPVAERPYARDIPLHLYQELLSVVHSDRLGGSPGSWVERLTKIDTVLRERFADERGPAGRTIDLLKAQALRLSAVAAAKGAYNDAIDAIAVVLAWDADNATAHRYLALAHAALGDAEVAEQEFKIAIQADSDHADLHAAFGELLILSGAGDEHGRRAALDWALDKAERQAAEQQAADQSRPGPLLSALVLRGLMPAALTHLEREDEMQEFFKRALTTDGKGTPLQNAELRAIAPAGLGQTDRAVEELSAAVDTWTPADKYREALYALLAQHRPEGAAALRLKWQEVIARNPEAAKPWG